VIVASTCTFFVGLQWGFSETLMPQFLTREYGEGEDGARYVYRIHSINLWGCVLGPPLVAAMSGHLEAFGVLMPGLWVMAAAPIFVIMFPNIFVSVITINPLLLPVVVLFLEFLSLTRAAGYHARAGVCRVGGCLHHWRVHVVASSHRMAHYPRANRCGSIILSARVSRACLGKSSTLPKKAATKSVHKGSLCLRRA
jgi:hypothetical protein